MSNFSPNKALVIFLFFALQILFMFRLHAQEERYFRKMFTGQLKPNSKQEKEFKYVFKSPAYQLDLNDNGFPESIRLLKKDGLDYIAIENFEGQTIFEDRLFAYGGGSNIFKLTKTKIAPHVNVLILHYYEGEVRARKYNGTARLYFLTIDKRYRVWKLTKGPLFWHEHEEVKDRYWQRDYNLDVTDFDHDGTKEIAVSYNRINRIYKYLGKGNWVGR